MPQAYRRLDNRLKLQLAIPRQPRTGNFVTVVKGGYVYSLTFASTPNTYNTDQVMSFPMPHPFGYVFNPPISPPYKLVALTEYNSTVPPQATPLPFPSFLPGGIPSNTTPGLSVSKPFSEGDSDVFVPGTTPSRISANSFPISHILILADSANTGKIWIGFRADISSGHGLPLAAGAANDFDIDDLNKVYILGENATDEVFYQWFSYGLT